MSKTAPLNNTYLGINGNYFTGDKLPAPAPNNPKVPFDAGQMFLDFPTYDAPINPNDVMLLENKFEYLAKDNVPPQCHQSYKINAYI